MTGRLSAAKREQSVQSSSSDWGRWGPGTYRSHEMVESGDAGMCLQLRCDVDVQRRALRRELRRSRRFDDMWPAQTTGNHSSPNYVEEQPSRSNWLTMTTLMACSCPPVAFPAGPGPRGRICLGD